MKILLITYDSNMYINYFPLGVAYVAAKLQMEGHEVAVYPQDVYHFPEGHLTSYLTNNHFDIVGVGMCAGYYQYSKLLKIMKAIPSSVEIWVGGHMVSGAPDYFRDKLKRATIFEGEFDYKEDLDDIPFPAWDLFAVDYYSLIRLPHSANSDRCFPVLSGRGCPYRCNFCYRMEEGYRPRAIGHILEEIQYLRKKYRISYVDFADELLMVNPARTMQISEALKPLGIKWMCNGRLNIARPKILQAMKDAGCVFINYGIESVDDAVLEKMNKKLTVKQITSGVEATLEAGISPGLNMLWGNLGDTRETLWRSVDFLLKYDDQAQLRTIRPVTPYPGCALYDYAIEKGLLKDAQDFYENKCKNSDLLSVNFTELADDEFYRELYQANLALIDHYYSQAKQRVYYQAYNLYLNQDTSFRGFRQT